MHPAYSVILFTTASGAGYGLLCLLGLGAVTGLLPTDRLLGFLGLGLALALVTAGLLSSTFHLGRPERAWRALSQWRSSWLSREGILALATYLPAGVLGFGWAVLGRTDGVFALAALAAVALAPVTVFVTGMIYQSLPTIRQWHQPLTAPVYVALALATGGMVLGLLLAVLGYSVSKVSPMVAALTALAGGLKLAYWRAIDAAPPLASAGTATGLGRFGKVRQLEAPHSQANFVMREMGFAVARKHAKRLRRLVSILVFAVPILLCLLAGRLDGGAAIMPLLLAVLSGSIGVVVERWLFFAEATHVVTNFYGADAA
jgi:DMSO reductase anchor subunit